MSNKDGNLFAMDKIITSLRSRQLTIATIESFTGGLLSDVFINHPGISDVFVQGVTLYQPESKRRWLGFTSQQFNELNLVSVSLIEQLLKKGIAHQMASIVLATTGNAGPSVQPHSTLGEVVIGVSNGKQTLTEKLTLTGNRRDIRLQGVQAMLVLLERFISTYY
jgi:nicotinamide-nucleotide amidase